MRRLLLVLTAYFATSAFAGDTHGLLYGHALFPLNTGANAEMSIWAAETNVSRYGHFHYVETIEEGGRATVGGGSEPGTARINIILVGTRLLNFVCTGPEQFVNGRATAVFYGYANGRPVVFQVNVIDELFWSTDYMELYVFDAAHDGLLYYRTGFKSDGDLKLICYDD